MIGAGCEIVGRQLGQFGFLDVVVKGKMDPVTAVPDETLQFTCHHITMHVS
jgi:hypothetical protein